MKIEDALKIIRKNFIDSKKIDRDAGCSIIERVEAKSAAKAYAHCIGLLCAVLKKRLGMTAQVIMVPQYCFSATGLISSINQKD